MISRRHRFHGYNSLNFVYRHGVITRDHYLLLRIARNHRRTMYRAAVIVSRKVNKSAVRRNRIRRRLYEIVRSVGPDIAVPYDIVLTVFSDQLADMPTERLSALVTGLLQKSGVVKRISNDDPSDGRAIVTIKGDTQE